MTTYIKSILVLLTAVLAAGCTMSDITPPPLSGPSELSLSLTITANPDVLSLDGSSQTLVTVEARDSNGQPAPNVPLRVEILADGQVIDFGTISARTLVTNASGRATFTYTAPAFITGAIPNLQLSVTPTGQDASAHVRRVITVRLVPPGSINSPPTALFTYIPANPAAFSDVRFDGSTSTGGLGAVITSYAWDFGDGTSGTGVTATHQYTAAGSYQARLTVTDSNGISSQSAPQSVVVGAGATPTAVILFSPASPTIGQTVFFNGNTSSAGTGHRLVSWRWNFGDGSSRSGSTTTRVYTTPGNYTVVLTVTDEVGQTAQTVAAVTIAPSAATASFTFSPTDPIVGTTVNFDGSASTGEASNTIVSYAWSFGDGATATGVTTSHVYGAAFTYTVRLTITDSRGNTATTTQEVTID